MTYIKSLVYPDWIYDESNDQYISPRGRLADSPGSPFYGQLSEKQLYLIKEEVNKADIVEKSPQKEEQVMTQRELEINLIKTVTIGSITVNWYRIT